MLRSMNSAVSSLKNHQTRMDVIGNNIANVNTTAYKTARVTFKDSFSQNQRHASGPSEYRGGLNPHQVGLGMRLSSIDNIMNPANLDVTDKPLDLYISGEGFFQVKSADGTFYTRDGNFTFDDWGNIVTQDGLFVQGYQVDKEGNVNESIGNIRLPMYDVLDPKVTTQIEVAGNLDSAAGKGIKIAADPKDLQGDPGTTNLLDYYDRNQLDNGKYSYTLKKKFQSNDKGTVKSLLGGVANLKAIDTLGKDSHHMQLHFIKDSAGLKETDDINQSNRWKVFAFYTDPATGEMIPAVGETMSTNTPGTPGTPGTGTTPTQAAGFSGYANFSPDGKLLSITTAANQNQPGTGTPTPGTPTPGTTTPEDNMKLKFTLDANRITGAEQQTFTVDLANMTQFEAPSSVEETKNNGYPLGVLGGYAVSGDGKVIGKFSNGLDKVLGQIVTATFANTNGLVKEGDNLWSPSANSGDPNIGKPGEAKHGILHAGALEVSNVDLAKEFTNMIITQRGFQANARTITTSDQMLQELIDLKR